jgi:uncharacterized protein (DUF885 family)
MAAQGGDELQVLRQRLQQKDKELEHMKAETEELRSKKDSEIQELKASKQEYKVYHILAKTVEVLHRGYSTSRDVRVLGRFVNFGVRVADVGVSRLTPWKDCENLGKRIVDLAPYLDEKVISPQIAAYRSIVEATVLPRLEGVGKTLDPYMVAARPYVSRGIAMAQPVIESAKPIIARARDQLQRLIAKIEEKVAPLGDELDHRAEAALEELTAEKVFEAAQGSAKVAVEFAKAHADDIKDAAAQGAELLNELATTMNASDETNLTPPEPVREPVQRAKGL